MRRRARVDENQKSIVEKLRKIGCSVAHTHQIGKGFVDIVVGFQGVNYLIEIKDGNKSPSQRELTPDEIEFHNSWRGKVYVIESFEDFLKLIEK